MDPQFSDEEVESQRDKVTWPKKYLADVRAKTPRSRNPAGLSPTL